tara:strand:- start:8845 stop:9114 length:270 start_codon:yes stop_codon:yes gene_type:complete
MKNLLFCLFLLTSASAFAPVNAQQPQKPVYTEHSTNKAGVVFTRVVNTTPRVITCWIRDEYTYTAFIVPANKTSLWYPIYGKYNWFCEL